MKSLEKVVDEKSGESDPKLPFPKSVTCLLGIKLFEKTCFQGIKTVLVIYLTTQLAFSPSDSTVIYHVFNMLTFLMAIVGAIISDCWLGKYKTILYVSISYAFGVVILNVGSYPMLGLPTREITIISLLLVAAGTGSLRPCLMSLGGDQFKRPEQDAQLVLYYSLMVVIMKVSTLIATAIAPALRNEVKCFGDDHCFPVTFGVSGSMLLIALVLLLLGSRWLIKYKPTGNIVFKVIACIWTAIVIKCKHRNANSKEHWLDNAEPKYGRQLINEVKIFLNVIVILIPIPMYFALNDQPGSRWTFQATTMNGNIGFYVIKPDQMQIMMPIMVILMVIMFDSFLYRQLERIGVKGSLGKMLLGTCMTATAYIVAGSLELHTEPTLAKLPAPGFAQLRIFNSLPCNYIVRGRVPEMNGAFITSMDMYETNVYVDNTDQSIEILLESESFICDNKQLSLHLTSQESIGYLIRNNETIEFEQNPKKDINGLVTIRTLFNDPTETTINFIDLNRKNQTTKFTTITSISPLYLRASTYAVHLNHGPIAVIKIGPGSVTTILSGIIDDLRVTRTFEITPPNTVHMLWLIPQYIFLAIGETMVTVTGLHFVYSEAPKSMKSIMQAFYLLAGSVGNLIDIIIVGANIFQSEAHLSYFFAGLMIVDVVLFAWLVKRYKRIEFVQD